MKCPYCGGTNLYLQRTSPIQVIGCKDCQEKARLLKNKGLSRKEIEKFIKGAKL